MRTGALVCLVRLFLVLSKFGRRRQLTVHMFVCSLTLTCVGVSHLPDYVGGWACFTVSIIMIGVLTTVIGDVASSFGCTIGLKDAVTAISFVAIGTSIPGKLPVAHYLTRFKTPEGKWTRKPRAYPESNIYSPVCKPLFRYACIHLQY